MSPKAKETCELLVLEEGYKVRETLGTVHVHDQMCILLFGCQPQSEGKVASSSVAKQATPDCLLTWAKGEKVESGQLRPPMYKCFAESFGPTLSQGTEKSEYECSQKTTEANAFKRQNM